MPKARIEHECRTLQRSKGHLGHRLAKELIVMLAVEGVAKECEVERLGHVAKAREQSWDEAPIEKDRPSPSPGVSTSCSRSRTKCGSRSGAESVEGSVCRLVFARSESASDLGLNSKKASIISHCC